MELPLLGVSHKLQPGLLLRVPGPVSITGHFLQVSQTLILLAAETPNKSPAQNTKKGVKRMSKATKKKKSLLD